MLRCARATRSTARLRRCEPGRLRARCRPGPLLTVATMRSTSSRLRRAAVSQPIERGSRHGGPTGATCSDHLGQRSEEPGDLHKLAVRVQLADIHAGEDHAAVGPEQLPPVAEQAVVLVDSAGPAERVAGELLMDGSHHVADPLTPLAGERWVDEAAVAGKRVREQSEAGYLIGLVVGRQIGVDRGCYISHRALLRGVVVSGPDCAPSEQ